MAEPETHSGERDASYRVVEGLHLRQWVLRPVLPLGVLLTNGAGLVDLDFLPTWGRWPRDASEWHLVTAVLGALLVLYATWMRVGAKGVLVRKRELTTHGVYARVRHPFYTASLAGAVGALALAGPAGALFATAWLVVALPVFLITIAGEEDGLSQLHPTAWASFAKDVPARLLPPMGWPGTPRACFSRVTWTNLRAEREPPRLLRFLAGPLAIVGARTGGVAGWTVVAVAALVIVLSHTLPSIQAPSRRARP